jgi:hypothetical protein
MKRIVSQLRNLFRFRIAEGASLQRVQPGRDSGLPKRTGQLSLSWRDLQGVEAAVPVGHCVDLGERRGSGSYRLSRLLLDLDRCRPGPRGLPWSSTLFGPVDAACAPSPSPSISTFVIFSSHSERSRLCRNSSRPPKRSEFLLSWDSPLLPLCRSTSDASTPGSSRSLRSDGATRRILFHPRGFSPPRWFPPHRCCGFVAPRCRLWGPTRFPVSVPSSRWRWVRTLRSPRRGDPTKSSPRQQPCRIAAVVASLPLPSVLPVSPARSPGLTKYVANKFVGVLRRVEPTCAVPRGPSLFRGRRAGVDPRRPQSSGIPEVAA